MKKMNVRLLCRTAILLALCIASQLFKNTSIYITGSIVNAILILATLSCGFLSGGIIALIAPFTAWLITGNAAMSAIPLIPIAIAAGNLVLVLLIWFFGRYLEKHAPEAERLAFSDDRFRLVLIIALVATALWASVGVAFLSSLTGLLLLKSSSLLILLLSCTAGVFLIFVCLWALVSRFPNTWTLIAGTILGSVLKALAMWLLLVKTILPVYGPSSGVADKLLNKLSLSYGVPQLVTALLGSLLAFLIWMPLKKYLSRKEG